MVNTGKPSRGCYMCRARRIKCDEGKPHCMRCQKSKRVCPGYRDAFELKLRDESKSTKKKLNRRLNQQQSDPSNAVNHAESYHGPITPTTSMGSHSRSSSLSSTTSQVSSASRNGTIVPYEHQHNVIASHMTTPIQQQAACYFLSNFVLIPEAGTMRGYLDFVLPLVKQKNPQTSLVYAFSAVTLASLSTRPNSKGLQSTADLWYLKTLKEINAALKDPKVASSDATLASVMLMASFEQLTPTRMKVGGWGSHLDGAVAVIKSTPIERWSTGLGRDIFIAVRAHMTVHCIANSRAADPGVDWMGVQAYDDIIQSFAAVNLKMAALRADNDKTTTLKTHTAENVEKVLKLLRRAEALDQEYMDWIKALPVTWAIKTVAWIDGEVPDLTNSLVHPGRVDAYGELWMAYKYNIVRACRLFIWTVILRCVAWLGDPRDYRLTPEYTTASRVCQQLIEDIVSSVPYFFGWNRDREGAMADKSNFACGATDYTAVRPLAGLFVMWPLFAAASSDFASSSQRIFLRGRLKHIAEMMGINQALILFQAQLIHPSIYIARERMSLRPTTCQSSDTQVKIISGVASAVISVPSPPHSQDGVTWTASPLTNEQIWTARASTPPEQVWQAAANSATQDQPWTNMISTPPQDQTRTATTPPRDQMWRNSTSMPPQDQTWKSTSPRDQIWNTTTTSPPHDQVWKATTPPHEPAWNVPTSAVPQDQVWKSTTPPHEQTWNAATSSTSQDQAWETASPPHEQIWQTTSPPQEQLWSASTTSPPHDMWKTSSPPHTQNHLWTSPLPVSSQPWKASTSTTTSTTTSEFPTTAAQQLDNSMKSFLPQEQALHDQIFRSPPVTTTAASCTGETVTVHDPGQVWNMGFEDSAPSWIPRTFTDMDQVFTHDSQGFERRYNKGFGVASSGAA